MPPLIGMANKKVVKNRSKIWGGRSNALAPVFIIGRFRGEISICPEILLQMVFSQIYFPQDDQGKDTIPTNFTLEKFSTELSLTVRYIRLF